jgi:hypothetical protein
MWLTSDYNKEFSNSENLDFDCRTDLKLEGVVFMDLKKATALLKEIVARCPELDGRNFLIMQMTLPHPIETEGYELVIRTAHKALDKKTMDTLGEIAAL